MLVPLAALTMVQAGQRRRRFYTGYDPEVLLNDESTSGYQALMSLAAGYQQAVEENMNRLDRSRRLVNWAIVLLIAAPAIGVAALVAYPPDSTSPDWQIKPVRGASSWGEILAATRSREHAPCLSPVPESVQTFAELRFPGQDCEHRGSHHLPYRPPTRA